MQTIEQRFLRGPNLWSKHPCLQTVIDLSGTSWTRRSGRPSFSEELLSLCPDMPDLGELEPNDALLAEAIGHLALQLQHMAGAGPETRLAATVQGKQRQVKIVVAYRLEKLAAQAFQAATSIIAALCAGESVSLATCLAALQEAARKGAIGTSTAAVVNAALARGIPAIRLTDEANLFQLGWGSRQKRLQATVTGDTSHVGVTISSDKQLTKALLEQGAIPVPKGGVAANAAEAIVLAQRLGFPVAVKPLDGNQGKGVSAHCSNAADVGQAFAFARQYARRIIVERHIEGRDYRVLVAGGRVAAVSLRRPPSVRGDGVSSVRELVDLENANPARGEGHTNILTRISLDEHAIDLLGEQGFTPESILPAGVQIELRTNANLSTGGTAEDVTDLIHPATGEICIRAARLIGLDIAGIDVVCADIAHCLRPQGGALIEVNAAPGIRMHEYPSQGKGRAAGAAIVQSMFGAGDGRIPVIAVTGTNGKTTTSLMIAHCARLTGMSTGVTTTEGVHVNDNRIIEGDCAGYHSARVLLTSPDVDIAVLETARGGILKRGLAFDRCAVAVVLNVAADHLGLDGVETLEDLAKVKAVVAHAASNTVVLNADDRYCIAMDGNVDPGVERIFFSMEPENPFLLRHLENNGRAAYLQDGALILADGTRHAALVEAAAIPATLDGHARYNIANALAAAAALMGADFTRTQIAAGLSTFVSDRTTNPLRSNIYQARGVTIVVDYAHNPAAYSALGAMARSLSTGRCLALITSPGDRRDADLADIGRTCANGFDEMFVYEADPRGRASGETADTILNGARASGADASLLHAIIPVSEAFAAALARCAPGDVLVFACGSAATAARETARFADWAPSVGIEPQPATVPDFAALRSIVLRQ